LYDFDVAFINYKSYEWYNIRISTGMRESSFLDLQDGRLF